MKRIVLCADDYGQALPISQAIIDLLKQERLTAVSCMVSSPHWQHHAQWLLPFCAQVDVGLHFNLTDGEALSSAYRDHYGTHFFSLTQMMRKALLRQLSFPILIAELEAQIEAFTTALGRLPAFIDGHQHVHQFPIVRDALMSVWRKCLSSQTRYIRLANPTLKLSDTVLDPKKIVINFMGAKALRQYLITENIQHNASFSGIYSFTQAVQYPRLFPQFLQESVDGGLIMCHPGLAANTDEDAIAKARYYEYQYLGSEQFLMDTKTAGIVLSQGPYCKV